MTIKTSSTVSGGFPYLGVDGFNSVTSIAMKFVYIFFASSAVVLFMFQKKMLSKKTSKVVSRVFFFPTLPITILMRIGNYWSTVDDTLLLGCAPIGCLGHPAQLHQLGVRGVINLCYEYDGPKGYYSELGMKQLHLPTVDHFEPSASQITEAVRFIQDYKNRGEKVYVHCKGGHGRSASIAMCWMMNELPDVSPKDINALLGSKRKVRKHMYNQQNIKDFYELVHIKK